MPVRYEGLEIGDRVQVFDGRGQPYSGSVADKLRNGIDATILIKRGHGGSNQFQYVSIQNVWRKMK